VRILLVEDDQVLAGLLKQTLTSQHYLVDEVVNGQTGLELAVSFPYDLILLDVMLPKLDGITVCRQIRQNRKMTPILLMTNQDSHTHKITGLDAGADDYLVKPFDLDELLARVRALLRRGATTSSPILQWGKLSLDPSICQVMYQSQLLNLTSKEYEIMELFLRHPQRIFSQSSILDHLWSYDDPPSENTVRAHIKTLRQKFKKLGSADIIETIYGLGYRLKRIEENDIFSSIPPDNSSPSLELKMLAIWEKSKSKYHDRVSIIEDAIRALSHNSLTEDLKEQSLRESHTLAGSLGTFGFPKASEISRQIENALKTEKIWDKNKIELLSKLVDDLRTYLSKEPTLTKKLVPIESVQLSYKHRILIIDDNNSLTHALQEEALSWEMEIIVNNNLSQARESLKTIELQSIILDIGLSEGKETGLNLLEEIAEKYPKLPVIILSSQESFSNRIKVAQLGARFFLQKPITSQRVFETINQVLQESNLPTAKLLIVDDDPEILEFLKLTLIPWGFQVDLLCEPTKFWETLKTSAPDLLILDIEMPNYNGIELCQVVRSDPYWSDLPILFLSCHSDAQTIEKVFSVGGDDYINKPIICAELIARISNRIQRTQMLRKLADIDSLTGLTNRRKSTQDIIRALNTAEREKEFVCFAILDLDHFKKVNDIHGHEVGDQVLIRFGELLKKTFRKEDIIARWGGEEFVLGLYGINRQQGLERIKTLLNLMHVQEFINTSGQIFHLSFSAGVAEYPQDGHDLKTLYHNADQALYRAKSAGRDRVFPAQ
jgi:diguanylate cyclase (GGDEF)-like protein